MEVSGKVNVSHYLVTRFNVPHDDLLNLDRDWNAERVRLFRKYCLPSVSSQTASGFKWLIFCDVRTPEPWVSRLSDIVSSEFDGDYSICMIDSKFSAETLSYYLLGDMIHDFPNRVITTILDSDDALSPEFLSVVEAKFMVSGYSGDVSFFLSPSGYIIDDSTGEVLSVKDMKSPSRSCCEKIRAHSDYVGALTTAFGSVSGVRLGGDVASSWMKVFHKNNSLLRKYPKGAKVDSRIVRDRFRNIEKVLYNGG